ncbi:MAG: potassium channel family protein [Planctomycetota bacterium]
MERGGSAREGAGPLPAHGGLLVLTAHVLVAPFGLSETASPLAVFLEATLFAVLVVVLIGVAAHRVQLLVCLALVGVATAIRLVAPADAAVPQASADAALVGCGAVAMWRSVSLILRTFSLSGALISASIGLYLLAGITWALAFHAVAILQPGSFALAGTPAEATPADLYFFSFVTLTTLGYGDISPVLPFARSLAVIEAVFGQVFLVALLGRIVSVQVAGMQTAANRETEPGRAP